MGVTQHCGGSDTSTAISNLLLLTGNYMRPGAGAYPLRGHNNVQGTSDFGSMPNVFSGYQKVEDEAVRAEVRSRLGRHTAHHKRPRQPRDDSRHPRGQTQMHVHQGRGHDHLRRQRERRRQPHSRCSISSSSRTSTSLRPARFADVVLPASPSLEKEGTFTSTERRIQRLYQRFRARSAIRSPTGRSFSSSPTASAPAGITLIPREIMDEMRDA